MISWWIVGYESILWSKILKNISFGCLFTTHLKHDHLLKDQGENITWYIETAKKYCKLNFLPLDPKTMKKKIRPANMFFLHIGILVWFPLHTKIVRTLRGFLGYKVIHHNPNNLYTFTTSNLRWVQLRRNAHYVRVLGHIGPIWATFKTITTFHDANWVRRILKIYMV